MNWLLEDEEIETKEIQNGTRQKQMQGRSLKVVTMALIACSGIALALYCWINSESLGSSNKGPLLQAFVWIGMLFLCITLLELIWRIVLVAQYKPIADCNDEELPSCTVVVPAYNEGMQIYKTLKCLADCDYPKDKFQLIAVDDGSKDDTWLWIKKAKRELGSGLTIIKQSRNKGKKHALSAGFRISTGDILVTVDSDSMIQKDTLHHLVAPFVKDTQVGAVAGNVRVLNTDQGFLAWMLDVAFVYSFDFIRASQSMVHTVMCTPGALAAYRKHVIMDVLDEWLNQTYCGQPATIGEDRAITNLILRDGYHVLFQQNAVVYTEVPVNYNALCKMYIRWERSDIRETIAMSRFAFQKFRKGPMLGTRINLLLDWLSIVKAPLMIVLTAWIICVNSMVFGVSLISGILIFQSLSAGLYAWKHNSFSSLWSYVYGFYCYLGLFWVKPYSIMTSHRSGWLTRTLPPDDDSLMFLEDEPLSPGEIA